MSRAQLTGSRGPFWWIRCGACAALLAGCPSPSATTTTSTSGPAASPAADTAALRSPAAPGAAATATIEPRSGSKVTGQATFSQVDNRVHVVVEVHDAAPGQHGLHIHEKGDCSDPAAKSAGDHFNPTKASHGAPNMSSHHAGDFGNIIVGADGNGKAELDSDMLTVAPGDRSVVGRAIVVHEKVDDTVTQPSGNSGARIGCGVINPKQS